MSTNTDLVDTLRAIVRDRQPDLTLGRTVTAAADDGSSNPDLDRRLFCSECLAGERAIRPDREPSQREFVVSTAVPGTFNERGRFEPVRRRLSYDEAAALAGLKAGTHGKQCLHCGSAL